MPNQSHSGIHGDPWHLCDRCGQDYRTSQLRRQPGLKRGLLVCPKCYDNPLTFYRDIVVQDVLSQSADEEMQVADILKESIADDSPQF
jgi:hypothetical protein